MRTAVVLTALAAALALQTSLAGVMTGGRLAVNLVLVAVVYVSLAFGPVTGLLAGAGAGLAQDALAGGIIGISGLAKTLIGFVVGVLGTQFIVSQSLLRLMVFVVATFVHDLIVQALYALVQAHSFRPQYGALVTQAVVNGIVGTMAFFVVERGPGMLQRRRARGASLGRRRY